MKTQFVLIACLTIAREALAISINTQVHEISSESQPWQAWNHKDAIQAASPVTFEDSDTQKDWQQPASTYNANIQSGDSGVAEVLKQHAQSVRIIDIIKYFQLELNLDKIKFRISLKTEHFLFKLLNIHKVRRIFNYRMNPT